MSLIEKLGGYEKAKEALIAEQRSKNIDPVIYINGDEVLIDAIDDALLDYRRQHNIFEVGDLVVFKDHNNALDKNGLGKGEVLKIKDIDFYDYLIFDCSRYGHGQKWFRHATDEEIKAGKRLEVDDGCI